MVYETQLPDLSLGLTVFVRSPYMYNEICFAPVNLSYVNFIIKPAKEPRQVLQKFSSSIYQTSVNPSKYPT